MNSPVLLRATAIAVGLALGTGAMAQTPVEARAAAAEAKKKGADARRDADFAKREADYAAAKDKCNAFAGEVKANCVGNAKARFDR